MARKTIILASAAWAMAVCAHAQNLPAPTTPLGGTEQIACIQSGAYAACNPSNIASYTASTLPASGSRTPAFTRRCARFMPVSPQLFSP